MKEPSIIGIFFVFVVLSIFFALVEWKFPAIPGQKRIRRGFWTDVGYWFMTSVVTETVSKFLIVAVLVAIYREAPEVIKYKIENPTGVVSRMPPWAQVISLLFVGDFIQYWVHRAFHRGWLWKVHAIHHSSEDLDWLSSVRIHPLNDWLSKMVQAVSLVLLGFSPLYVAGFLPFLTVYAIALHANLKWTYGRFGYVIASPVFHRWHHTSQEEGRDKNFAGLFPVIDWMFGTLYLPKGKLPEKFGAHPPVPEGFLAQMVHPFRHSGIK